MLLVTCVATRSAAGQDTFVSGLHLTALATAVLFGVVALVTVTCIRPTRGG